jgi:hypothetical protein
MESNFEFKKLGNNKCAFVMHSEDIERTEVVNEEYVKKHYSTLKEQKGEILNQLSQARKTAEQNKVEKSEDIEKFLALVEEAGKYKKYHEAELQQASISKMLTQINLSLEQMEKAMPELKRLKK